MKTILINTYDPAGRFDLNKSDADIFFSFVAEKAENAGFNVEYTEALSVDENSERFVTDCFKNWG